ncbi:hypothetical protein [Paenilisteria rocourtiae]|uniref:Uncharacterized protein n=1 Tax=Listeria rocourtiae TaxID=647910 RepID=A0A4R6ZS41_9LIST|nr:hypothetical protein [Listeria rocourtiae]EUJ48136.1 hypothetical protein PROCOU_06543 [Listeria rocourtiae FSL F6-920]MBC1603165.1 hypothetical protein [Listeria rocourtiae]TDR55553.1 hypothetical protein DFP96_101490 [Listeria rocourtiae]
MLLWISAGIYVLVSGVLLLLCKKYRFRIVIALSLIMLFLFDATPFSSVLSTGFSMLKTIVLVGIVLLIVTYFKRQHKQTP